MNGTQPVVLAAGLTKIFGGRTAVADVELALGAGDCLAVFGPNGAGKTTLLRLVAGLLKPSRGAVHVHGVDVRRDDRARGGVGLISHQSMLYAQLTVLENVTFAARLHGMATPARAALDALQAMHVADRADAPVRTLSRGLQQRVSIARATVHGPGVVLLDEPYTGLDESGSGALTTLLQAMRARGATLVLVTHNVPEGLALATHAGIMTGGRFARLEARPGPGFDVPAYAAAYRDVVLNA
jgi:heme exporter protein A